MRQIISALAAAIAVMAASAAPALACGGYVPCAPAYYAPAYAYSGCNTGCGGWAYERLADPVAQYHAAPERHQYYYVNQGPTFSGPGAFAPYPVYREAAVRGWHAHRVHRWHHHRHYGYREPVLRRYY